MKNLKKFLMKCSHIFPDRVHICVMYYRFFHKLPNLREPKTYNEKIQWLKLHDRNPNYTIMADKYHVKEYIANKIGTEYVVPLLGVWKNFDEIDFDALPEKFVLKCNNGHGVVICTDKKNFNKTNAKRKLDNDLKNNLFWYGREWAYKDIPPCILAEKYLEETPGKRLIDYKIMCFNGKPRFVEIMSNRKDDGVVHSYNQDIYNLDWTKTTISQEHTISDTFMPKPGFLDEMLELSEKLAEGIINVRVDWYYVENQLYLGELTFYEGCGFAPFDDPKDDYLLGSLIKLPYEDGK